MQLPVEDLQVKTVKELIEGHSYKIINAQIVAMDGQARVRVEIMHTQSDGEDFLMFFHRDFLDGFRTEQEFDFFCQKCELGEAILCYRVGLNHHVDILYLDENGKLMVIPLFE